MGCHHFLCDAVNLAPMSVPIKRVSENFVANVTFDLDLRKVLEPKVIFGMTAVASFVPTGHADMHVAKF